MGGISLCVLLLLHRFDREALATQEIPSIHPFKGPVKKDSLSYEPHCEWNKPRTSCKPVQGPLPTRTHAHGSLFLIRTPETRRDLNILKDQIQSLARVSSRCPCTCIDQNGHVHEKTMCCGILGFPAYLWVGPMSVQTDC